MAAWRSSVQQYGIIAQVFHWLIAIVVFAQILIGIYVADLPLGIQRLVWISRHKSIGITLLALMVLRLAWRMISPPPPLPNYIPAWERRTAELAHRSMYLLVIGAAIVGWLSASAFGLSINWFGVALIPDLIAKDKALATSLQSLHKLLVFVLSCLIALHVAAALRHAVVKRDDVLSRMLPGKFFR